MKRGKEEEKTMGPLFPRLHVNDTSEKGGPRAPPRNKMALYEQLSIPSQRFGSGVVPLNSHNKPNMASSASLSQGDGVERNTVSQRHLTPSTDGTAMAAAQLEQRKKVVNENEFVVPVFVQARVGRYHGKIQHSTDRESVSSISSNRSGQPVEQRNTSDQGPKHCNSMDANFRQEVRNQGKESMKAGGQNGNCAVISDANQSIRGNVDGHVREAKASSDQERSGHPVSNLSRSHEGEACLNQESRVATQVGSISRGDDVIESTRDRPRSESRCGEGVSRLNEPENGSKHNTNINRTCISLQLKRVDKGGDVFETTMVESISGVDIAPDDVVGIIGQKHFWKARKAIVNQQRMFASQVFELHKLIQVQRLIAGSPNLLLDGAFLGKSPFKCTLGKKLPTEFVVKPPPPLANCKDDSEKPIHKNECSAENVVTKTSLSSMKSASQSMNYGPHMGHPQPVVTTTDNKTGPWCFPQPPGPQWLVPVMSPSEGLVYKPYPGPLPGAVYGGYGPLGAPPVTGNFTNSPHGVPASHPQGIGSFPGGNSPVSHPYFPAYGMPVANPAMSGSGREQVNPFVGPGSHSQTGPIPGGSANLNMEQQSSCNVPTTQKNGSISQASKYQVCRGSDLQQGSTASSPGERATGISHNAKGRDPLQLFPMAPVAQEGDSGSHAADKPSRVIKVVPHNPRSATESAARIFRFIQEERKQYNYV